MSLKSALFEMKEAIMNQVVGPSEQDYIHNLETKNRLRNGSLVFYYNNLLMLTMNSSEYANHSLVDSKKVNRKWIKIEIEFMFHYIKERQEEGALNITEILEEVAQLLNRGYQSVNYKYYSLIKTKDKKEAANQNSYQFITITEKDVPVLSTEVIRDTPLATQVNQLAPAQDNDDLLDILSGLISNVQQLPGINLNQLLRSLFQLTNLALQNQDAVQQIESMKSEVNLEKEAMQEQLMKKEQQFIQEKKRNDELQFEVSKLAKEISAFNLLGDAAKIQQLKSYNQRLNYIIDSFGLVLRVSS
ncbi:hypothetical protein BACCIP111895_00030 [Neobacillus rhizosphaerae]|uniref:DUF3967 domain-containing protein n=1 Tax=Neobacillus rhizosphaerae TaxID=2880965 RepID=A0ABN8KHL7_9BACI|nr:hypothetical protein [Neobacillus rhizosphaerae]CAH2712897.1 hypothetical protein BACCIP111895_00030 [Neobacillus rhizosphaerae]